MWRNPLPLRLIPTDESESFRTMPEGSTGLPLRPHPGAFGFERLHHTHEGVDLYAPEGTQVTACEDGVVVAVLPFTGAHADSPWWHDTWAVLVEGHSGVIVYGEITPTAVLGQPVEAGEKIGTVTQVLKKDKGRPMSMLHLELYRHGVREPKAWTKGGWHFWPDGIDDPTGYLLDISPE